MKWFRDHIRNGAKLALFALAVELVLSLGHLHLDEVHAAPGDAAAITHVEAPSAPDTDHQQHRAGLPCDICAVMAIAGHVLFSPPPILLLPDAAEITYAAVKAEFDHLDSISGAPQPRGPPNI
ncbi:DUF2946 domain-containing protein [Tardiphaga alba]|uniref:DUF2946 domain-containing protein n=1 Tax=Tardiphaga alba TaxID=340268 RepID=A0ABX8A3Y9_9BRAD|nr:DUF2946 domain-containing protein [Tardiphaga alba]QUS38356.1 DUF2946 domain-containing protein [Tardiphaga alba]